MSHFPRLSIETLFTIVAIVGAAMLGLEATHFWQWPSVDLLPIVARFRDPAFLPQDLYTTINGTFSARFYFTHFVDSFSRLSHLDPAFLVACLNPAIYAVAGYGLYRAGRALALPMFVAAALTLVILSGVIPQPTLGLWRFQADQFVPSWAAASLFTLALALASQHRFRPTATVLGLAALLHPTTILMATPLVAVVYSLAEPARWSPRRVRQSLLLVGLVVVLVGVLFVLPARLVTEGQALPFLDTETFYRLYVEIRHPHHYLASAWPVTDWYWFAGYSLLWVGLAVLLAKERQSRLIVGSTFLFAIATILAVVSHVVLVNGLHNRILMILSPIRLVSLSWPFFLILAVTALLGLRPVRSIVRGLTTVTLPPAGRWFVVTALLALFVAATVGFGQKIAGEAGRFFATDAPFYACVQEQVPADARVVVHPQFDPIAFRIRARRAVYGDDVFPFHEAYLLLWWQQYTTVHGETPVGQMAERYDRLELAQFQAIRQRSGVSYFLVRARLEGDLEPVCTATGYTLVRVP